MGLLLAGPAWAQQAPPPDPVAVRIPFTYDPLAWACIVIQISVNHHRPLPFIVDTGQNAPLIIEPWAAQELGVRPSGQTRSFTAGPSGAVAAHLAQISEGHQNIRLVGTDEASDWIFTQVQSVVMDSGYPDGSAPRIAGSIGLPVIQSMCLRIDFPHRLLLFATDATSFPVSAGGAEFPLRPDAATEMDDVLIPADPGDGVTPMLLDTGGETVLPVAVLSRLHPMECLATLHLSVAGATNTVTWLIPRLSVGPLAVPDAQVISTASGRGILGLDILSRFVVTLDWPHQRMLLTPAQDPQAHQDIPGAQDVSLAQSNRQTIILQVVASSPAAKAGLLAGQRLIRIDGQDADATDVGSVATILNGYSGTKATVTAEADGKRRDVSYTRRGLSDPETVPAAGFQVLPSTIINNHVEAISVLSILCASRAYKAGVRPGDELLAINSKPVKSMPKPRIDSLLANPSNISTLTIRHQGETKPQTLKLSEAKS